MRDGSAESQSLRFTKSHLSRRGVFSYDEMDIKVLELLRIVYPIIYYSGRGHQSTYTYVDRLYVYTILSYIYSGGPVAFD